MIRQQSALIESVLADALRSGVSADKIARLVADACSGADAALTPIIGPRGVAALFKRSLHLTAQSHPWLACAGEDVDAIADVDAFRARLAQQGSREAAACGQLLLENFNDLLTHLIGASLCDRLLRSVWASFLSGPAAAETAP